MQPGVRDIDGELGLEVPQRLFQPGSAMAKENNRFGVISATLLVTLLPLFALIALAIKATSRLVFNGHWRHGRDGRTFRALKFASMVQNADRVLTICPVLSARTPAEWERDHKKRRKNDPRITAVEGCCGGRLWMSCRS